MWAWEVVIGHYSLDPLAGLEEDAEIKFVQEQVSSV